MTWPRSILIPTLNRNYRTEFSRRDIVAAQLLNTLGLKCPQPLLKIAVRAVETKLGDILEVLGDCPHLWTRYAFVVWAIRETSSCNMMMEMARRRSRSSFSLLAPERSSRINQYSTLKGHGRHHVLPVFKNSGRLRNSDGNQPPRTLCFNRPPDAPSKKDHGFAHSSHIKRRA